GNAECPAEQHCESVGGEPICTARVSECTDFCTDPAAFCIPPINEPIQCVRGCRSTADCDGVDCEFRNGEITACGSALHCAPEEFHYRDSCLIHQSCWTDDECQAPYTCRLFDTPSGYCGLADA